jgi:outer membrane protein assembly factor BamB
MYFSGHLRAPILALTTLSSVLCLAPAQISASGSQSSDPSQNNATTTVNLRWDLRPGVSRYRLQLAHDAGFTDIVFDAVVIGNQHQISDLPAGKYFWRVAALKAKLEFSPARIIEVRPKMTELTPAARQNKSEQPAASKTPPAGSIATTGGWRAAIGDINCPVPAHLRSRDRFDIAAVNNQGVTFALDAASGELLWSARPKQRLSVRSNSLQIGPLITSARSGLDNLIVIAGSTATKLEGATGRELWNVPLSAPASGAAVVAGARGTFVFVIDNSMQRLFILDATDGNIVSQTRFPHRVVGAPAIFADQNTQGVVLAFVDGRIEVRDETGTIVRSGDASSAVTTPPLFVKSPHGAFIIVGARDGLTALNADDLRPLGRVSLKDDAPRGTLAAEDLNRDGTPEVLMLTEHGRLVAVNAADGQVLWNVPVGNETDRLAFADVNEDGVIDVLIATNQAFAVGLSGRDGSLVWRDAEDVGLAANHATLPAPRPIVAVPFGQGAMLIAGDSNHTGLRAIEFPRAYARPKY